MRILDRIRPSASYRRDREPGAPLERGFSWFFRLPALDCEVLGHRPVNVEHKTARGGYVECSRCHRRPLRPGIKPGGMVPEATMVLCSSVDEWLSYVIRPNQIVWTERRAAVRLEVTRNHIELLSAQVSIGTPHSETPIDAHLILPGLVGLYIGLEGIGDRLAARRDPADESRVTGFRIGRDAVSWQVWDPKHSWVSGTSKWRHGHTTWKQLLTGPNTASMEDLDTAQSEVVLPDGHYPVTIQHRRRTDHWPRFGRTRVTHTVSVETIGCSIPVGGDEYGVTGTGCSVPADATRDEWVGAGVAALTATALNERAKRTGDVLWAPPAAEEAQV